MKMKMTATGDTILIQGYPEEGYKGFKEVSDYIKKGDARLMNLESVVSDWNTYASSYSGGTWMNTRPEILDQIQNFGFNFYGFANNHTMDMGPDGLLETLRHASSRGLKIAGAGADLAEAEQPVYKTFQSGRVAFISASATFNEAARAGYASRTLKGRPGLNYLRTSTSIYISPEHFRALDEIIKNTQVFASRDLSIKEGFIKPFPDGTLQFGNVSVRLSENGEEKTVTKCNAKDLKRFERILEDTHYIADYTVVMLHAHTVKAGDPTLPDDASVEFAHFCIDRGACAVVMSGTHQLKSVEVYKGKPIFYSLGNFCFQSNMVEHQPADMFDKYGFPQDMSDVKALAMRSDDWKIGQHTQYFNFRTLIPYMEFEDGKLTHLEMKPIELGFDKARTFKGLPYPANKKVTEEMFSHLKKISKPFKTKLVLRKDGIIEVPLK